MSDDPGVAPARKKKEGKEERGKEENWDQRYGNANDEFGIDSFFFFGLFFYIFFYIFFFFPPSENGGTDEPLKTGLGNVAMHRRIVDRRCGISIRQLIVISLFAGGWGKNDVGGGQTQRASGPDGRMGNQRSNADEPLFSSNRHCNMKHRQLPDKIIIRLITCQLQTPVVCLLIYRPPRQSQFQQRCPRPRRVLAGQE